MSFTSVKTAAAAAAALLCAACWTLPAPAAERILPEHPDAGTGTEPRTPLTFLVVDTQPPYQVLNAEGRYNGYDVDVAYNISRYIKRRADVLVVAESEAYAKLRSGAADAIVGVEPSRQRDREVDYTSAILINKMRLFVHEETVFIHTLKDLAGVRVGVNRDADIRELLRLVPGVKVTTVKNTEEGLRDLVDRKITVYLGGEQECQYYIRTRRLTGVKAIGSALMLKRRCIAVKKGNDELLRRLNSAIEEMKKDFTMQAIYENWFGVSALAGQVQRKFLAILLAVLGLVATVLLVSLIWNQKLADAVSGRTQELQAERAHFQNIFDHASDGIAVINPANTVVVEGNKALEEIMGFTKTELQSFRLTDLDASEDRGFEHNIERVMASEGESTLFETRLHNKSGQVMDLLIHARTFPYKGKKMIEAIVRDITERKKIQEMKDTILQDVAHELKTPMAKMAMSIDLLERNLSQQDRGGYSKFFDICHRSISRLQNTIDGILNLSRLESQSMKMESEVFPVQDVLMTVVDELNVFAQKKGITLTAELPKEPYLMKGDMEMIRRLFTNIIHNAIKFTDKGGVRVVASEDKYKLLKISVHDEGIGLDPEDLKKIFTRFYQKTPTYEGSGIGLTIAQKIVSLHNGVIWAESQGGGKGTTMNVMFPMYAGQPA